MKRRSDADADVLAEYVIALLKHDGDEASVRSLCEQEIPDFLTEGQSISFLLGLGLLRYSGWAV